MPHPVDGLTNQSVSSEYRLVNNDFRGAFHDILEGILGHISGAFSFAMLAAILKRN